MLSFEWAQDSFPSLFPWCLVTGHLLILAVSTYSLFSTFYVPTIVLKTLEAPSAYPIRSTASSVPCLPLRFSMATTISCWNDCHCLLTGLPTSTLTALLFCFQAAFRVTLLKCAKDYATAPLKNPLMASYSLGRKRMAPISLHDLAAAYLSNLLRAPLPATPACSLLLK